MTIYAYSCCLCGNHQYRELYPATFNGKYEPDHVAITDHAYGRTGRIVRCENCSMVSMYPRPAGEELVNLYANLEDPCYQEEEAGRRVTFRRVLGQILRVGPPNRRLFDVGAGTGMFVDEAQRSGFEATGIEPSRWAVERAHDTYGLRLIEGVLPHPDTPARSFGTLTMLDVIEHVDDPRQLVEAAGELLVVGGLMIVTTPNFASLVSRVFKQRWWHCRLAHVQYFTKDTLQRLLCDCGFTIERTVAYGWTFSLRYWMSRLADRALIAKTIKTLDCYGAGRRLLERNLRINFHDSITVFARRST